MVKKDNNKRQMLVITVCLFLLAGIIVGAVIANKISPEELSKLSGHLDEFIYGIKNYSITRSEKVSDVMIKYGKYVLSIWLCGFFAPGAVLVLFVLAFKGISYGFTTSLLVKQLGNSGIYLAVLSYLPQNIVLIPVYIAVSYYSIELVLLKYKKVPPKARLRREKNRVYLEYIIILMGSTVLVCLASLIEVYIIPILLNLYS